VLLLALASTVLGVRMACATPSPKRPDPTRLLFLIEYVGTDYDQAVDDGAVIDQLEYGEMLRFTREAIDEYGKPGEGNDEIAVGLETLAAGVSRRADVAEIRQTSRALISLVAQRLEGIPSPPTTPDLENGARLFDAECATCHGDDGDGDGPQAAGLDPAPASFRGDRMDSLTPRHVYNTLTLGVDGTGMPSFAGAYDEQQRWDLAFHVMTLRDGFAPAAPPVPVRVSLEELVASTNAELLALLRGREMDASGSTVDWVRRNPGMSVAEARPAALDSLAIAVQLQDAFGVAAGRVSPSVVSITSHERLKETGAPPSAGGWQAGGPGLPQGTRLLHAGSGIVLDNGRDVATCDHLLRRDDGSLADVIRVARRDGTAVDARVVGMEPALDLAIVRVEGDAWTTPEPALRFADSDGVKTGHWLIALGDLPGSRTSLAVGVASAPAERQCYQEDRSATMLQSSIAVGPEGLGGPVADIEGNLVGLSVRLPAIPASPSGPARPSEHAILPANLLRNLRAALEASGSTDSPWLGVSVLELELLRAQFGETSGTAAIPDRGVFIDDVFDPSPATRAGVERGDFLVRMGDADIGSVADFQRALYTTGIGKQVRLGLLRGKDAVDVTATVERRPGAAVMR